MRVRSKLSSKEPNSVFRSTIAIALVFICVYAANWQYERGVVRHAKNFKIESNTQLPKIALSEIRDLAQNEWRTVTVTGEFDRTHEVLLRNRYSETGVYGFEYLTLFKSNENQYNEIERLIIGMRDERYSHKVGELDKRIKIFHKYHLEEKEEQGSAYIFRRWSCWGC